MFCLSDLDEKSIKYVGSLVGPVIKGALKK